MALKCRLISECDRVLLRLDLIAAEDGGAVLMNEMMELIIRVPDYLLDSYDNLRRKVDEALGGEALELLTDKLAKAEKAEKEARERGRQETIEAMRAQGVDPAVIERVLASLGVPKDNQ